MADTSPSTCPVTPVTPFSAFAGPARRGLLAVFAGTAVGATVVFAMTGPSAPSATAAPDPCSASQVAKTIGAVATSTGTYLDTHPQTDAALTAISQQQPGPQSLVALKGYFDANPQAAKELQQLQSPLSTLSSKCDLPLTLPQVLGLMQAAQGQQGSAATSLPDSQSPAPSAVRPAASGAVPSDPSSTVTRGGGPLPGPAPTSRG